MFCTNCGTKNADGAKFCTGCGAPLMPSASVNNNQQQAPAPQPSQRVQEAPVVEEQPPVQSDSSVAEQPRPKRKKSKARVVIPVLAAVIIVAAVTVAAVFTKGFGLLGVPVRATANDYSWEELSKISAQISACSSQEEALEVAKSYNLTNPDGTLDGTQVKQLELTDGTTAEVQILGFYHDDKTDGGKAGISFMFKNCVSVHAMNAEESSTGGWEQSEMRSYLNNDMFYRLPDELQNLIVQVDKSTNNVGVTDSTASVTKTSDRLWLLSNVEVVGEMKAADFVEPYIADINNAEGRQYQLFKTLSPKPLGISEFMIKSDVDGDPVAWWLRTPYPTVDECFVTFGADGEARVSESSDNLCGTAPCFCL